MTIDATMVAACKPTMARTPEPSPDNQPRAWALSRPTRPPHRGYQEAERGVFRPLFRSSPLRWPVRLPLGGGDIAPFHRAVLVEYVLVGDALPSPMLTSVSSDRTTLRPQRRRNWPVCCKH